MSADVGFVEGTKRDTEYKEPGDDDKFSHFVPKRVLNDAIINGTPVTALCGKTWVPTRDPEKFPVCPECKEIYESMDEGGPVE